jgi:hypothetical protein
MMFVLIPRTAKAPLTHWECVRRILLRPLQQQVELGLGMSQQFNGSVRDQRRFDQTGCFILVFESPLLNDVAKLVYVCKERLNSEEELGLDL